MKQSKLDAAGGDATLSEAWLTHKNELDILRFKIKPENRPKSVGAAVVLREERDRRELAMEIIEKRLTYDQKKMLGIPMGESKPCPSR